MSEHRVVSSLRHERVVPVLADGGVIVVPDVEGYALAVRRECPAVWPAFWALTARHCVGQVDTVAVGQSAQAAVLCDAWDGPLMQLTDRVWPGPLTVIATSAEGSLLRITMPKDRALRGLCRTSGPLVLCGLRNVRGEPITDVGAVLGQIGADEISLVVEGGPWRGGLAPTLVDCTQSPPRIVEEGAVPSSFIEGALMMAARRKRRWGSRNLGAQ